MITTAFTGRCPACGQGHVFSGPLSVRERCEACGAVYFRGEGDWIGATVVSYMLASVWAIGVILVLWTNGTLSQRGSEWIVALSTVVFALVTFRFVKGMWVGMLHDWGYVYADPTPAAGSPASDQPATHAPSSSEGA